jgi:hypothetical protein
MIAVLYKEGGQLVGFLDDVTEEQLADVQLPYITFDTFEEIPKEFFASSENQVVYVDASTKTARVVTIEKPKSIKEHVEELEQQNAELLLELADKDERINTLEQTVAQLLLDLTMKELI